jgi:2-polyprenyl-6-methoxyphenol hydroxylase-like FAD-dependent oxidoreductase
MRSYTLMRGHLVGELRAAAEKGGVELVTGERLAAVDPDGTARFASGRSATGDLLVGADGIRSVVRDALAPTTPAPRYAGVWVISGRSPSTTPAAEGTFNMTVGAHGAFVHVVPADGGDHWWQAQVNGPIPAEDDDWLGRLDALYAAEPIPRRIIAATTALHRHSVNHVLPPVSVWHDARTVLVGDAAHLVGAGQGASMAIEDGVALGVAIGGAATVEAGLTAYETVRRERVTRVLRAADDNREAKQAGPIRRRLTEIGMSLFFARFYERATGWLYDYEPAAQRG